jgi:hypothetical protein
MDSGIQIVVRHESVVADGCLNNNPTDPMPLPHSRYANSVSESRDMSDSRVPPPEHIPAAQAGATFGARALGVLRYLDVVLVLIATVPALASGVPVTGWVIGAGGWILQRVIGEVDRRWVRNAKTPRAQLGVSLFEGFARIWLLAIVIIVADLVGGRADGETAALLICGAYSVAFVIKVFSGPPRRRVAE